LFRRLPPTSQPLSRKNMTTAWCAKPVKNASAWYQMVGRVRQCLQARVELRPQVRRHDFDGRKTAQHGDQD